MTTNGSSAPRRVPEPSLPPPIPDDDTPSPAADAPAPVATIDASAVPTAALTRRPWNRAGAGVESQRGSAR